MVAGCAVLAGAGVGVRAAVAAGRRGPVNMASDGLVLWSDGTTTSAGPTEPLPEDATPTPSVDLASMGVTQTVAYLDYADPASAAFWAANGTALEDWLASSGGYTTLELHPLALTARSSDAGATSDATPHPDTTDAGLENAARAANAFACVAANDPDLALAVNDALFAASGAGGLTDDELVALVRDAGVSTGGWERCIRGGRYADWVARATDRATTAVPFDGVGPVSAAPLVVVGGRQYTGEPGDADAFAAFLAEVTDEISAAVQS